MAFDGIVTNAMVNELNSTIIEARVEKICVPSKLEILLSLHKNPNNYKLLISIDPSNSRIALTKAVRENPIKAFQFCMVLRKHLQGSKILSISQVGLDRIVEIVFENIDDLGDLTKKKLIIEIMGKHSNIILTTIDNKILDSIKHVDSSMSSIREVLPAHEYFYPENQDKSTFLGMSLANFTTAIKLGAMRPTIDNPACATILSNEFVGFSRLFTNSICSRLNVDTFNERNIEDIYTLLTTMFHHINQGMVEFVEVGKDYHINLDLYSTHDNNPTILSDFLDSYYSKKETIDILKDKKSQLQKELLKHVYKYTKNLDRVNEVLKEIEKAETYKQYGEIISSNIFRMKIGLKEIELENFYDDNNLVTIPLKENLSPSQNAQAYFKKYTKLRNSISHAEEQKTEYTNVLSYLDTVSYEIEECPSVEDLYEIKSELMNEGLIKQEIKKKKEKVPVSEPLSFINNDIEILVGKNNIQNDKLTFKIAHKKYTWLHAKDIHGSHVIIMSDNVPNEVLVYAASLAAKHSGAKDSSKIAVDYTLVKNVKKIPGAKPGMVTYTDYKTIII